MNSQNPMSDFEIFIKAVQDGNLTVVSDNFKTKFLENRTNLNKRAIHFACEKGHIEIVKFLLQNKCSIECEAEENQRPIHYACQYGHFEIVKFLFQNKCNIECETYSNRRPIHFACLNGHLEIVKFLLENKCNIGCEDKDNRQPIHLACEVGNLEIVTFLCQNKWSIECEDKDKKRPIHYACQYGYFDIVKFLFQNTCNIECEDRDWKRPIHLACEIGNMEIVKFLLESKCSIECETYSNRRPIHYACQNGHVEVVKFLFQHKCRIECFDYLKMQPIHVACEKGYIEIVLFLLQNNCTIECEDYYKRRPIHLACMNGHLDVVKILLQNKCSIDCEDNEKRRPIHWACEKGYIEIVKFLLQNNCDIECEDYYKRRPIHNACENGNLEIVKFLFQSNCELNCITSGGETPMEISRKREHESCENYLNEILEHRKIFDCVQRNDAQALGELYSPTILMVEQLETGFSVLEVALKSNAKEIIQYLLNKPVTAEEISAFENFKKNGCQPDTIQLIQECLLYRSIRFHDADGFHLSGLAKTINEHGRLVKSSFLEVATEYGCKSFIHSILKKSVYNEEEWTKAKDLAILKGHDEIAEVISKRKDFFRKRADKNFTWLHSAVCDNDPDMVTYILDKNLVNPDSNNEVVGTALALAYIMCYEDCIEVLEKFNVDVNTQNKYSQSPLHEAIASGMIDHCSYLISRIQDIDRPGFMGFTSLQMAVIKGCEELCDQLVKNGADCVRYVEITRQSPIIQTAFLPISKSENAVTLCMKIHETIYPCFMEVLDSNKMKRTDENGNSLLHVAVTTLQPDLCNYLIKYGSSVEALNDQGNSPLLELLCNARPRQITEKVEKAIEILNILIDSGADVNKLSYSGTSVFQVASQWNSERLMLSLLQKQPKVMCITEADFKMAFMKQWFEYATILISLISEDCLQSCITVEILHMALHFDPKLLMSLFAKSSREVQQSVIEDLLDDFALKDNSDDFANLLHTRIIKPKLLANGETLLTNLLKKKECKYCWALINCPTNKEFIGFANLFNQTPLQIAMELELFDFIYPLILNTQLNEEFNWDSPLSLLLQKLSMSTNDDVDQKILAAIKVIIRIGGDIFKETVGGSAIVDYCTRVTLKNEIMKFATDGRKGEPDDKRDICCICLDREVNCVLDCGHTFCIDCCNKLCRCAVCYSESINPKILYSNWNSEDFFRRCRDPISLFTAKHEPRIMEKIKNNANLNQGEKIAVNLVFRSLKQMGQFHDERTGEINEISVNYLDKYQEFAHQNVVAMRLTEVILYSFCSSQCRSLVVPENYFLKYFHKKYSPEIQLGAAVANSFVEKDLNEKSGGEVILFMLELFKEKDKNESLADLKKIATQFENESLITSDGTLWGFSREEVKNCLHGEILKWTEFLKNLQGEHQSFNGCHKGQTFPESLYPILCKILEGINYLDSSQISSLPLMSINIFNEKHKPEIFNKWKDNKGQLNEQDKLALNCFYVSINILSKCCLASEKIPLDEMLLMKTFKDFSDFISSNYISQRICEALLYCICNIVDKREISDKGSWVQTFQTCFLNSKLSTEISLASAYILSYLITEEDIKFKVLEYLTDVLGNPTMRNCKRYCGFRDEEIKKCFETLTSSINARSVDQSIIEHLLWNSAVMDEYEYFLKLLETKKNKPKLFSSGETLFTSLLKAKNIKYCWPIIHYAAGNKFLNMKNAFKRTPLQVAIEAELYDLISPLIFKCHNLRNEDSDGNTPLAQLFEKLSKSTDICTDQKLMTAIKAIISRGGDIYMETVGKSEIINFCTRWPLKNEIELFQKNERSKERDDKNICKVCFGRKVDCAFLCGHMFCMDCGKQLPRC